ncbi:winged helix-turn-helix transcriptional regulator [Actinacidiphila glaucinigra]|uniref:winged helix-turn-helix transcriptional regulator n=1 Tax=Actinacidiphila glaucinigra TaxID=235986 RepID=UPI0033DC7426
MFGSGLELLDRHWTEPIITAAHTGATRFRDYRATVPGTFDRLLALRLKELEAAGPWSGPSCTPCPCRSTTGFPRKPGHSSTRSTRWHDDSCINPLRYRRRRRPAGPPPGTDPACTEPGSVLRPAPRGPGGGYCTQEEGPSSVSGPVRAPRVRGRPGPLRRRSARWWPRRRRR